MTTGTVKDDAVGQSRSTVGLVDALCLASDFYIGKSADEEKVDCLFIFGSGIVLSTPAEKELAQEVVDAMKILAAHIESANAELTALCGRMIG